MKHPHMKCPRCQARVCLITGRTTKCRACGWESGRKTVRRGTR